MRVPLRLPDDWDQRLRLALDGVLGARALAPLGSGLDCWAVLAGDDVVVRIPQNDEAAAAVERDQSLLPELARVVPVPIPLPLFAVANPLGPGRLGAYRLVRGEMLVEDQSHERGLLDDANAATIARVIESIASFPVARAAELGVPRSDGRAGFVADLARIRVEVAPLLGRPLGDRLVEWYEAFVDDDANFANPPTVIHADLSLDHLLVADGRISGLIDFGDVEIGDPDAELLYLWAEAGPDFVSLVQAARRRRLTPQLAAKLSFLAMTDELGDVLWGIDHDRDEIVAAALVLLAPITLELGATRHESVTMCAQVTIGAQFAGAGSVALRNVPGRAPAPTTFYVETLGCPKNQVDSDKLIGTLVADGMAATDDPAVADLVVVNTCAFIDAARRESIDTVLALDEQRRDGSRLVVTGCMAERYGDELATALPEVDRVAGFGVELAPPPPARSKKLIPVSEVPLPTLDLLNLPRPKSAAPWAYVKIAEGCDRSCGFCAIPSFRGKQRSRDVASILDEVAALEAREIVLVAQDLASYGKDRPGELGAGAIVPLVNAVAAAVDRVRLLYLYPSDLTDGLIDAICASGVPYFDLSLQHVSKPLLRRMRRWGDGRRFLDRIDAIREREPDAAFRSNFIVGYPGETEADHDELLAFVEATQLDWCGFFAYSREDGTYAADLDGQVPQPLMVERLAELTELQDEITASRRDHLIGATVDVLVDRPGIGRSHREAPEIDGVVLVDDALPAGTFATVEIVDALGPDLIASGAAAGAADAADEL